MAKTKISAHGEIAPSQRRYLYRQFLMLYLHSPEARSELEKLVARQTDLAQILGVIPDSAPVELTQPEPQAEVQPTKTEQKKDLLVAEKHSYRHLFSRLRRRYSYSSSVRFAVFVMSVMVVSVVIQLVYPTNRALPFARLQANGFIGFSTRDQILEKFKDFDTRTVTVHTHNKNLTTSYTDLGVTISPDDAIRDLTNYPRRERLIPFSILFAGNKTYSMNRNLNDGQLKLFVRDVVAQTDEPYSDAAVERKGTKIIITQSKEGYAYQDSELRSQVFKSGLENQAHIVFKPTILPPAIPTDAVTYGAERMQQRINAPLTIRGDDKSMVIQPETIASWVDITRKTEAKTIELTFNRGRVADSLRGFPGMVDYASRSTVVTMLNGVQVGSAEGAIGKSVHFDELVDRVVATTAPATESIEAPVETLMPKTVFDRRYTKDNIGLQSLFTYWSSNHSGQHSIDFRTADGRIAANQNPYQLYSGVGIYRIYIAHNIYGRIAAHSINGSTQTSAGANVDACLSRMMRDSDEACTNALGDMVGWGAADDTLHAQGFDNTTLARGAALTTANDTSDWMAKLLEGSIINRSQTDALTNLMRQSSVRSGIPSGSKGIAVANKVGSFGRVKHDVGIVYHPKGTYVLSVLSEGSTFANIADLANEIDKVMSQ